MENILIFRILVRTLHAIHKDNTALDPDEVEIVINISRDGRRDDLGTCSKIKRMLLK